MSDTTSNVPAGNSAGQTHWSISHGMSGYLPMSDDTTAFLDWSAARDALLADMRDYADTDDDMAWDALTMVPAADYPKLSDGSPDYGDDAPTMLATVQSMIADGDVAPTVGEEWTAALEDGMGRTIYFSLQRHDSSECEDSCDVIGGWKVGSAVNGYDIAEVRTFADWSDAAGQFRSHARETADAIGATLTDDAIRDALTDGADGHLTLTSADGREYLIYLTDED